MTPVCDLCDGTIETANRQHPGFGSPGCPDLARAEQESKRADLIQRRRDRAEQAGSHTPVRHY